MIIVYIPTWALQVPIEMGSPNNKNITPFSGYLEGLEKKYCRSYIPENLLENTSKCLSLLLVYPYIYLIPTVQSSSIIVSFTPLITSYCY